jgi:hypothetical protein
MISDRYTTARIIISLFISFVVISYLFVRITGMYNGDLLLTTYSLTTSGLTLNLFYTIIPFLILYFIYKYCTRIKSKTKILIPIKSFGAFLFFLLVFQIMVSAIYGVGRMGQEAYQAPSGIKLLIQISNRFNSRVGVFIYIIININKKDKLQYVLLLLLIVQSFIYLSLGVFNLIGFMFIVKYGNKIFQFIKKWSVLFIIVVLLSPTIMLNLYTFRNEARAGKDLESDPRRTQAGIVIFGRLIGRLSSYSASAVIMEKENKMIKLTKDNFTLLEYPKQALGVFIKNIFPPKHLSYGHVLYGEYNPRSATIVGAQGALMLGYYHSFSGLVVNSITLLIVIFISFRLASLFHYGKIYECVLVFLCLGIMSGAVHEIMFFFQNILVFLLLFLLLNFLFKGEYNDSKNHSLVLAKR